MTDLHISNTLAEDKGDEVAKLSVYIADELWNEARKRAGDKKASQIIQDALQHQVDERDAVRSGLAVPGEPVAEERFRAVLDSVRSDYRAEYRRGYEAGLEFVDEMGFWALQLARSCGFDLADTLDAIGEQDEEIDRWLTSLWNEIDVDDEGKEVFRDGVVAALKDLWSALRNEGDAGTSRDQIEPEPGGESRE